MVIWWRNDEDFADERKEIQKEINEKLEKRMLAPFSDNTKKELTPTLKEIAKKTETID